MRHQPQKKQLALLAMSLAGAMAFAPPSQRVHRTTSTRRFVSNKPWLPLPFTADEKARATNGEPKTTIRATDFETPKTPDLLAAFFPQDTDANTKQSMGDLVDNLDADATAGEANDNLVPIVGAVAVAALAAVTSSGMM